MDDLGLINYCELHCQTERALFVGKQVNRMLALAGYPEGYVRSVPDTEWISLHSDMAELCKLAKRRLQDSGKDE